MQDAREHILDTTLQLFLRNSYRDVTLSELVKASGLSKGAFYHYFSSKEQLFEEVVKHYYFAGLEAHAASPVESLAAFYRAFLARSAERLRQHAVQSGTEGTLRANHYLLLFDALKRLPAFRALRLQWQQQEVSAWAAAVQQARATGEIHTSLTDEQVAKLFIHLGDGIAVTYVLHEQTAEMLHEVTAGFDALYQLLKA